jgi:hypothetical protein
MFEFLLLTGTLQESVFAGNVKDLVEKVIAAGLRDSQEFYS